MKLSIFALTLSACLSLAHAQESIEPEKLQKIASRLVERASDQENLPLTMEVDRSKAVGMIIKEFGTVVLPANTLSAETLSKVGSEILPVGHLWLNALVPAVEGKPLAEEKRRYVMVITDQEEHALQLLLLGLRKSSASGLELVIFAKDKDPVLTLPLKEETRDQSTPLELNMRQGTDSLGLVDLHILGKLVATLPVERP